MTNQNLLHHGNHSQDSQIWRYDAHKVVVPLPSETLAGSNDLTHGDSRTLSELDTNILWDCGVKADVWCWWGQGEKSLLCWEHLLVCCWPSLPAAISAKREHLSQAAGHIQYLSDPQRFRLPWPLQPLGPETPAVSAGQSAHVNVWDRLGPEALSP